MLNILGYYCSLKADNPTPTDNISGNVCPLGKYCLQMSKNGIDCPKGRKRFVILERFIQFSMTLSLYTSIF